MARFSRLQLEEESEMEGDFGKLRRYLDVQFETQTQLLEQLTAAIKTCGSQVPTGISSEGVSLCVPGAATLHPSGDESQGTEPDGSTPVARGGATRDSVQSRRHTFVRSAMLKRQLEGQRQASRAQMEGARGASTTSLGDLNWRGQLRKLVASPKFSYVIMCLIVLNGILLGVEIDVAAQLPLTEIPQWFGIVNALIVFAFLGETTLKLLALGCRKFWRGADSVWNAFDFTVVIFSLFETVVDWSAQSLNLEGTNSMGLMRALRLARILRGVRIIRLFRYFSALRALLVSIMSTISSLLWTLLLLLILFYIFAIIFTQMVTDHCRFVTIDATGNSTAVPVCLDSLAPYWSNVMDSMHTLFMSITGGVNWLDVYAPLREVSMVALWLFNLYVVIGFFTILNVVTGVFVNTAIESASADKDIATIKQAQQRLMLLESLRDVFQEMAGNNDARVSLGELQQAIDTNNTLGTFMQSLGISTDDVWTLFLLIDVDDNGVVDIEEFVAGCMQLRGPAQSLQVAKMAYENKLTRQAIKQISKDVASLTSLLTFARKPPVPSVVREAC